MGAIAGIFNSDVNFKADSALLKMMSYMLKHRGEYKTYSYCRDNIGLSQLSFFNGKSFADNSHCIQTALDGEIFNRKEIFNEFKDERSGKENVNNDAALITSLYRKYGDDFVNKCNGQFAIAIFHKDKNRLTLVRDRAGTAPLYYTALNDGTFLFGSEIKSLFCSPEVKREIDIIGLEQIFTLWVTVPPRTAFSKIFELPPGCMAIVDNNGIKVKRYWKHAFPDKGCYEDKPLAYYTERLRELLFDAVSLRINPQTESGSYLSGGLDSAIISALAARRSPVPLKTFSVTFSDAAFDEREFQKTLSQTLKSDHRSINVHTSDISVMLAQTLWHAEIPVVRTALAPLFALSRLVNQSGTKTVLTGEGADELFGGYDIFKESAVRRFWARFPDSKIRPALLRRTYPFIAGGGRAGAFWQAFFKQGLTNVNDPFYSHRLRWNNTSRLKKFCSPELLENFDEEKHVYGELEEYLNPGMKRWEPLSQAQYLEMVLFTSNCLLTTQGDRMLAANSICGRFPFLDHRVIEFAHTIPPRFKLNLLNEKYILKETFKDMIPRNIFQRVKQPYRSPISDCFRSSENTISSFMLSDENLKKSRFFNAEGIGNLIKKVDGGGHITEVEQMALSAAASTELIEHIFVKGKI